MQQKPRYDYHKYFRKMKQQHSLLSYKHLKCITVISNYAYLAYKVSCNFIQKKPRYYYQKNSEKNVNAEHPIKLQKLCQSYILKCVQSFVRFYGIESKIGLSKEFWKQFGNSAPYRAIFTKILSLLFLIIYILYVHFCAFSSTRNQDQHVPKIPEKHNISAIC